jgi:phosphatidylglycerol:prolipoprotein diacylglycerol transferase
MIFPRDPYHLPRHPSQLYEAALEGIALFLIMQIALRVFRAHRRPGLLSAIFFLGYGTFRFISEFFREPDTQFIGHVSMGMALSIPVWLGAGALFWLAYRKPVAKDA